MLDSQLLDTFMQTFVGYGNPKAPLWFLGMEEWSDSTDESLRRRFELWRERGKSPIEDLRDYHLGTELAEFFGEGAKPQHTWEQLIRITFQSEGRPPDTEAMREYQIRRLGRRNGETALFELYPLPAKNVEDWPYARLSTLSVLRDRKTYCKDLAPTRIQMMQRLVDEHQPRFVVMYGTTYRSTWERLHGGRLELRNLPIPDAMARSIHFWESAGFGKEVSHPDLEFFRGCRGHTEMILIKHPNDRGITPTYFEAVGCYLHSRRVA